jgi:hypothetical protein
VQASISVSREDCYLQKNLCLFGHSGLKSLSLARANPSFDFFKNISLLLREQIRTGLEPADSVSGLVAAIIYLGAGFVRLLPQGEDKTTS